VPLMPRAATERLAAELGRALLARDWRM